MRLARIRTEVGPRAGVVVDGEIRLLRETPLAAGWRDFFSMAPRAIESLAAESVDRLPVAAARFLVPVPSPSKIVCVGLNYRDHAAESNQVLPSEPLLFAKFPSSLLDPGAEICWPAGATSEVDWEAELAVVIGRPLTDATVEDALAGVFGFTAANDVTARDAQTLDGQWDRGKGFDTFCPLGPIIVSADEFGDPQTKQIWATVNGQPLQQASTSDMVFPVGDLLSWISRFITLVPGDLVLTGTPPGVGAFRKPPIFLRRGDVVEVGIEGVGTLRNPVGGPRQAREHETDIS